MPFYEYECPACKYYAEVLQKISDKPLAKCPSCGKKGFKRLMSAPVFRLKGSGWYETDFKSDQDNKRNLAGAEPEEAKPATDEKGGAKPEAKGAAGAAAAEAGAAGAEKPKSDTVSAKADGADGADKSAGSRSGTASRRDAKHAPRTAAKSPARPGAKRKAKSAPKRAARKGRRR
jgi:putative FmdB family regulatory protein